MSRERADQLRDLGRWHEAAAAYAEALAIDPGDDDARLGRADVLAAIDDGEGALRELDAVLQRTPDRTEARYQRAITYARLRRDADAVADLDQLIAAGFTEWYVWSDRGGLALRTGLLANALADFQEAERRAPTEPSVSLNLGVALLEAGRAAEAFQRLTVAAAAGFAGAAGLREQARRNLATGMSPSDVDAALAELSAAASRDDVVCLTDRWPAVLAPEGLAAMEGALRARPSAVRAASASRLDDLRRLSVAVRGIVSPVGRGQQERPLPTATADDVEHYQQAAAHMALLHDNGRRREAADLAPDVAASALRLYGPRSVTFGKRMLDVATLTAADGRWQFAVPSIGVAIDVLMEADPAGLPDGLVNCATLLIAAGPVEPGADPLGLLKLAAKIVRELPYAVDHATIARVHRAHAAALRKAGRADRAEEVLRESLEAPGLTAEGAEDSLATVLTALAEVLFAQDRPREAVPLQERVIELARSVHGEIHRDVALAMRGLGRVLQSTKDDDAALNWLSRSLSVWERLGPEAAAEIALTTADLATTYAAAGAETQARDAIERTVAAIDAMPDDAQVPYVLDEIATALRQLGDAEAELAVRLRLVDVGRRTPGWPEAVQLNALADVYFRLRRFDEAQRSYSASLDAVLRDPSPDLAVVAILRHNLANVLGDSGRSAEALVQHEEALAALSTVRDPGHPDMLQFLVDTATFAADEGQANRARELLEQARPYLDHTPELLRRAARLADRLGGAPMAGTDVGALADAAADALRDGDDDRAEQLFERALVFATGAVGPDHPVVATLKHNFAVARSNAGRTAGTIDLFRDALRIRERTLEPDDERLANTRLDLAQELFAQQAEAEAEAGELAAAALTSRGIERRPVTAGRAHTLLGNIAQRRGRVDDAEPHLDAALRLADATGTLHNRITARSNLVQLRLDQHRLDDAARLAEQTLALCVELLGPDDRLTVEARFACARVARARGRFVESEQQLRQVLDEFERLGLPDDAFTVSNAQMELSMSLHNRGRVQEAETWSRRALAGATGRPYENELLVNRARMFLEAGNRVRAQATALQAVNGIAERHGTEDSRYGNALGVLGAIEVLGEQRTSGIRHLVEAHDILVAAHGPDHPGLLEPLTVLAQQYQQVGARETAHSFARRAVALARRAYGPEHPGAAPPLLVLARSAALDGDVDEALRLARAATDLTPDSAVNLMWLARLHAARGEGVAALDVLRTIVALEDAQLPNVLTVASEAYRRAYLDRLWATAEDFLTVWLCR